MNELIENILSNVLKEDEETVVIVNNEVMEEVKKEIEDVIVAIKESMEDDKLSISEAIKIVIELCEVVEKAIEINESYTKEEIKDLTIQGVKDLYYSKDGLNNPDIKYVPEFIEGKLENLLFSLILPSAFDYLFDRKKKEE